MPKAPRKDPTHRSTDALTPFNMVMNAKPGCHYVLVGPEAKHLGPEYYEFIGYEYVLFEEKNAKCTRLGAGKWKDGDRVSAFGQFLMECSPERYAEIQRVGPMGNTGQSLTDAIASKMNDKKRGGIEPLRGTASIHAATFASDNAESEGEDDNFLRT